jgi:NAD(P)H-dependent FMN reductase
MTNGNVRFLGRIGHVRRRQEPVLRALTEALKDDAKFDIADIVALPYCNAGLGVPDGVAAFNGAVDESDGLLILTPQYNFSVPGVLKKAIDRASRPAPWPFPLPLRESSG